MAMRLILAVLATVLALVSAVIPALLFGFGLVTTKGRVNALVVLAGIIVAALWAATLSVPLRALERYIKERSAHAVPASVGAVWGFLAGFLLRDAVFVTGPNSDYPWPAYGVLYGVTLLGAVVAVEAWPGGGTRSSPEECDVPHNSQMQLTSGAAQAKDAARS
jgi:hypothetical protein